MKPKHIMLGVFLILLALFVPSGVQNAAATQKDVFKNSSPGIFISRGQNIAAAPRNDLALDNHKSPSTSSSVELIGQIGGDNYAVEVLDNYAYVGFGPRVIILDISNPANPTFIGKTPVLPGIVYGIDVVGNYAYVVDHPFGLSVIDITNKANPQVVGSLDTPGAADNVVVSGSYAYIADNQFLVIDISNPASPHQVGSYATFGKPWDLVVAGEYAYVVGDGSLYTIHVLDPAAPHKSSEYFIGGYTTGVAMYGNYVYTTSCDIYWKGFAIFNISNPAIPQLVGSMDYGGPIYFDVAVSGNYAYIGGFISIDVSNPSLPRKVGVYTGSTFTDHLIAVGNFVYLASSFGGLSIVNVSDPTNPYRVGGYESLSSPERAAIIGDYGYVASSYKGVYIVNISNPSNPYISGLLEKQGINSVVIENGYAYLVGGGYPYSLFILDITNPAMPIEIGSTNLPSNPGDLAVSEAYAYIADGDAGLQVVDVSNPYSPIIVGSCCAADWAFGIAISGNYAYLADSFKGLRIINIADPFHPNEVGFYDTLGQSLDVDVFGDFAFVADNNKGLRTINVSNPTAPFEVGSYQTTGNITNVSIFGNYAYVSCNNCGLHILNISNPVLPFMEGFYDLWWPGSVNVTGGYVYVTLRFGGLYILRFTSHSVFGYVTDINSQPVADVNISAGQDLLTTTDAQGFYTFADLSDGSYTLTPSKFRYTFLPVQHSLTIPSDGEPRNFTAIPVPPKLKLLFVPLNWPADRQLLFDTEVNDLFNIFLNQMPLNDCRDQVITSTLDVATESFNTFTCSDQDSGIQSIRAFVRDDLQINLADYDVIVGLVIQSPCGYRGASNSTLDALWSDAANPIGMAHELGHNYGLSDEYCSNLAGSNDPRCNDGDPEGDGAVTGDVNWLDANAPCDCPPDGSNDSTNNPCCNFGGNSCTTVDYGVCCLGNKNSAGGRSIMSSGDATGTRIFDTHDLAHLTSLPELTCDTHTGSSTNSNTTFAAASSQPIVGVSLLIHPDDTVTEDNVSIGFGRPTQASVLAGMSGDYNLLVLDKSGETAWSQDFQVYFDYMGPMFLGVDYSSISFNSADVSFRIPQLCGMNMLELYHNGVLIYSKALPYNCPFFLPMVSR